VVVSDQIMMRDTVIMSKVGSCERHVTECGATVAYMYIPKLTKLPNCFKRKSACYTLYYFLVSYLGEKGVVVDAMVGGPDDDLKRMTYRATINAEVVGGPAYHLMNEENKGIGAAAWYPPGPGTDYLAE
jgi:hypothetical protein